MPLPRRVRHGMIVSAAWIVPAILGSVNGIATHRLRGESGLSIQVLVAGGGDWLIYAVLTPAVFAFSKRLPMLRPHLWGKFMIHMIAALVFCVAWAAGGTVLKAALTPTALSGDVQTHFAGWLLLTAPFGVAVYLGLVASEHGVRYFVEGREREMQMARLTEQLTHARLAALQASVHPHFLFNTLNTINVLVRDGDHRAATKVIDDLSALLRRMLGGSASHEIALSEELEIVRHYLAIEQARFPDRLRVELSIDPALSFAAVPGFSVQHLVENAMRHGIARCSDAGTVLIRALRIGDVLEVTVVDDGAGFVADQRVGGHGLENTRERLGALYGERASLVVKANPPRGTSATMCLPFRLIPAGVES